MKEQLIIAVKSSYEKNYTASQLFFAFPGFSQQPVSFFVRGCQKICTGSATAEGGSEAAEAILENSKLKAQN